MCIIGKERKKYSGISHLLSVMRAYRSNLETVIILQTVNDDDVHCIKINAQHHPNYMLRM